MSILAPPRTPVPEQTDEAMLSVDHAKIGYVVDGVRQVAVGDVTFDVRTGETIMLLGPSGCGKSTLLKTVAGFLSPVAG